MSTTTTVNRRNFLQQALIYAGAGLAAGGAAAMIKGQLDAGQAAADSAAALRAQAAEAANRAALLQSSLAAAEAQLAEVQPQFAAALARNAELQNSLAQGQQENDALRGQLAEAQAQVEALRQLVALYDNLESSDLDGALAGGLAAAAAGFAGALGLMPVVTDGLRIARGLLDSFERQFPTFRTGLDWLQDRLDTLTRNIQFIEKTIAQAIAAMDPLASRMEQLVEYVLKHLPFGIGRSVQTSLEAIDTLYSSLPDLVSGAHTQVVDMLGEPFGTTERSLSRTLLQPVREKALAPSEKFAAQVKALNDTFVRSLHDPARQTLERRAQAWKLIRAFREMHNV